MRPEDRFAPAPDQEPERITGAAVRFRGKIFTGPTHAHILEALGEEYPGWFVDEGGTEDGFLTDTGRFVDRQEGGKIAEASGVLDTLDEKTRREAIKNLRTDYLPTTSAEN